MNRAALYRAFDLGDVALALFFAESRCRAESKRGGQPPRATRKPATPPEGGERRGLPKPASTREVLPYEKGWRGGVVPRMQMSSAAVLRATAGTVPCVRGRYPCAKAAMSGDSLEGIPCETTIACEMPASTAAAGEAACKDAGTREDEPRLSRRLLDPSIACDGNHQRGGTECPAALLRSTARATRTRRRQTAANAKDRASRR